MAPFLKSIYQLHIAISAQAREFALRHPGDSHNHTKIGVKRYLLLLFKTTESSKRNCRLIDRGLTQINDAHEYIPMCVVLVSFFYSLTGIQLRRIN